MIVRRQNIVLLLASVLLPTVALAGPVQDGEAQLRATYADYRIALFQSSAGNAEATTKALQTLGENWGALTQKWTSGPPPQYADDAQLPETLEQVRTVISNATEAAGQGDLPKAHTTLEAIRSEIGDLHGRNGLIGFSDRMNAYHAEMEKVLDSASDDAAGSADMPGAAAVLAFLAAEIAAHPAPEANDPAYAPLVDALLGSVNALQSAAESGDAAAVKAAIAGLKPAYSKLFVKFG
jgi:hypothetical protein